MVSWEIALVLMFLLVPVVLTYIFSFLGKEFFPIRFLIAALGLIIVLIGISATDDIITASGINATQSANLQTKVNTTYSILLWSFPFIYGLIIIIFLILPI